MARAGRHDGVRSRARRRLYRRGVHADLGHLPGAAIEGMLNELATALGSALGQERIYVAFAHQTWILDPGARGEDD